MPVRTLRLVLRCGSALLLCIALTQCAAAQPASPQELVTNLAWRCIGPAVMGGRIDDVAVVEADPSTAYVATATAGLWKTTNHGTTFSPIFDGQPCQSIGAVAVSQTDPRIVWVGTGEANNRQSSSWGCGVFKSTDGGATWQHMGLSDTLHIARIAIHPTNPDIVYVAAVGHLWGPNEERGLYRTTDGGKTWRAVLHLNADTGCTDVALDPQHPSTVFAAMYQRRRAPWGFVGGGPHSGVFRSHDGGETWERLAKGLPQGDKGRIGLDVYRRDPRIVYAVVEARDGGVFRSEDGGDTWVRMSATNPRPMYFSLIRVDPNDDKFVWLAGVSLLRSKDGGKTFGSEQGARLHADIHAIWIDPRDSRHMLVGCDGGIQWSYDRGQTWDHVNIIPLAQFYHVAHDMRIPYHVAGGLQDNGSWIGPSSLPGGRGPSNGDWASIGGGDGFYCAIDWSDPSTVYSESQNGAVRRVNLATGASKSITPMPPPGEPRYRWDWCTPFMLSPHNSRRILLGGNRLFISNDRGDTWRRTEDLSTSPKLSELTIMGIKRGTGYPFPDIGSDYGQIVTLTESPLRQGTIYVGTDDGNLQISRDDGKTWKNVAKNVPGLPAGTYVSRVHASPHALGRVYAAFDGHRTDDYKPYIYVSEDFGETWTYIANGIPPGSTVNVVRDHPHCENLLFAGTDRGLYVSFDRGHHWTQFGKPLPALRVDEVLIHPRDNDLIVATHARGIYVLDDISILVAEASPKKEGIRLLPPRPAVQYRGGFGMSSLTGNRQFLTRGAPTGAQIRYWLPREPTLEDRPVLTIETRRGVVFTTRRLALASAGYNVTTWDMRRDPPLRRTATPPRASTSGSASGPPSQRTSRRTRSAQPSAPGSIQSATGSRVPPGEYVVRLRWGDEEEVQRLTVLPDPRLRLKKGDYQRLYTISWRLSTLAADLRAAEERLAGLRQALAAALDTPQMKAAPSQIDERVRSLLAEVRQLEDRLGPVSSGQPQAETAQAQSQAPSQGAQQRMRLTTLVARYWSNIESIPELPSRALDAEIRAVLRQGGRIVADANRLLGPGLKRLNAELTRHNVPPVAVNEGPSRDLETDESRDTAEDNARPDTR